MENWSGPSRALEEHLKLLKISAESKRYIDRMLGKSTSFMDFIATPHREYTLGFATTYAKFPADLDGSSTASVRSGGLEEEYWTQRNVETAARLIKVEYEMLDEAVTYYVSDPLTQLITEAADTMLSEPLFPTAERPFQALVDNGINPNLLRVISRGGGTTLDAIGGSGPLAETRDYLRRLLPSRDARITLAPNVSLRESVTLDIGSYKAFQPPVASDQPLDPNVALYWTDVLKNSHVLPPIHVMPRPCWRFHFSDGSASTQVRFDEGVHHGRRLYERLRSGAAHGELRDALSNDECALLDRLMVAKMVVATEGGGR